MRKGIILAIGGLLLLAGCGSQDKGAGIPVGPKWKGEPYRLAFDNKAAKPNPTEITIPPINFTANPDALVTRVLLVLKVNASGADAAPVEKLLIGNAVDIKGANGTLPADYLDRAKKGLSEYLETNCMKGKVDVSVALARSSLVPTATVAQADDKRLSDWLPIELVYKNPHSKCK
jgi:hypothetical protein